MDTSHFRSTVSPVLRMVVHIIFIASLVYFAWTVHAFLQVMTG